MRTRETKEAGGAKDTHIRCQSYLLLGCSERGMLSGPPGIKTLGIKKKKKQAKMRTKKRSRSGRSEGRPAQPGAANAAVAD